MRSTSRPVNFSPDVFEPTYLPVVLIKIALAQPLLEAFFSYRPFRIERGKPRRIPVTPLQNHVLPEDALECET